MLINDGEMSKWSYTHFTIINENFTIISLKLTIIHSFDHHWKAASTAIENGRELSIIFMYNFLFTDFCEEDIYPEEEGLAFDEFENNTRSNVIDTDGDCK